MSVKLELLVHDLFAYVDRLGHPRQTRPGGDAEFDVLVPIPANLLRRLRAELEELDQQRAQAAWDKCPT